LVIELLEGYGMIWESETLCSAEHKYLDTGAQPRVPAFLQDLSFNPIRKVCSRKLYLRRGCVESRKKHAYLGSGRLARQNILNEVYV
jgi:hypothetical protein